MWSERGLAVFSVSCRCGLFVSSYYRFVKVFAASSIDLYSVILIYFSYSSTDEKLSHFVLLYLVKVCRSLRLYGELSVVFKCMHSSSKFKSCVTCHVNLVATYRLASNMSREVGDVLCCMVFS